MRRLTNLFTDKSFSEKSGVRTSFWDYLSLLSSGLLLIPLGILLTAMTTRIVGTEGYGNITIFNLVSNVVVMFTTNWTAVSLLRFGREEYDQKGKLNHTLWARTIILTPCLLAGASAVYLFRGLLHTYMGMPLWIVGLVVGSAFVITGRTYLDYILQAIHRIKAYAAAQFIYTGASIVALTLIWLGWFTQNYVTVIILGLIANGVTLVILSFSLVPLKLLLPVKTERKMVREVFTFSHPILIGNLSAYVVNWIDVVVIKYYFSISDVGGYQLAYNIFNLLTGLIGSATILMTPILVSFLTAGRGDLIRRYSTRLVPQGALLWATIVGLGLSLCQPFFPMVFSEAFGVSATYFQFLALGLALSGLVHFYSGEITAYKLIKLGMMASVARAVVNVMGDLLLVPWLGPVGASLATTGGIAAAAILYLMICQHQLQEKLLWQLILVLPALLSLIASRILSGPGTPVVAIFLTLASSYYLAKRLHLFRYDDLTLLDHVEIPAPLKKTIVKLYPFLATETKTR